MKHSLIALLAAGISLGALTVASNAQNAAPPAAGAPAAQPIGPLANTLLKPTSAAKLTVTSSAFADKGTIPLAFSQSGESLSPPLAWSGAPEGTKSFVILTEDAGAGRPDPITHWIAFNIPANVTSLPQGISGTPTVATPPMMQGMNTRNTAGYMGMGAPAGTPHAYHFEVFALDKTLDLDPAKADRKALLDAMQGHVLATGELVGMFAKPA